MKEIIEETGIEFKSGQKLSLTEMNKINDTLNKCVKTLNLDTNSVIDLNYELGQMERTWTFDLARQAVPAERRVKGITLRFLDSDNGLSEYIYCGNDSSKDWNDVSCWRIGHDNIISGGEW